jgi:hypothetical protein
MAITFAYMLALANVQKPISERKTTALQVALHNSLRKLTGKIF